MVMALPRPSTCGTMLACSDNLFRDAPPLGSPSLHSANSSISTSALSDLDVRLNRPLPRRPLSPAFEEDNRGSARSLRLSLSPRFSVRRMFNRGVYYEAKETRPMLSRSMTLAPPERTVPRRPSLPKLQTSYTSPPRRHVAEKEKPLLEDPIVRSQEISCHRCYYFAARNCKGWVMGGNHGDACEQCLQAGFFGAP